MRKYTGIVVVAIGSLLPILLWYPQSSREINLLNISRVFALVGTVLFSTNFILSARLKSLESFFGGLNKIYIIHHTIGQLALIFLCFHPLLLGVSYLKTSVEAAFLVLFPPLNQPATWFGFFSLSLLIILLVLTLFVRLPYHIWKLTHKFMGLSLFLASLHVFLIPSDISVNPSLRFYMLGVIFIGLGFYFYRTFLGRFFIKRQKYKVESVSFGKAITQITMSPVNGIVPKYLPGQFIFVSFLANGVSRESHPFSLTSSPNDSQIAIAAKVSGDYTGKLTSLKVGSIAQIEGPFGRFSYKESPRVKQIWIAGGIGITPFVSMAKSLPEEKYDIKLYHSVGTKQETVFNSLLNGISSTNTNFSYKLIETKKTGRLTSDMITKEILDFKERDVFICGPLPMMKNLRYQFNKLGIRNSHIFTEEFSLD